jgi:hypothetical protein
VYPRLDGCFLLLRGKPAIANPKSIDQEEQQLKASADRAHLRFWLAGGHAKIIAKRTKLAEVLATEALDKGRTIEELTEQNSDKVRPT